jgi:hypothetical protein
MNKRYLSLVFLAFLLLWVSGCQKASTNSSTTSPSAAEQSIASQTTPNQNVADNLPPQTAQLPAAKAQTPKPSAATPAPVVIPAGTTITVRLQQSLSSATAVSGQHFEAVLERPLVSGDRVVVPAGTPVEGHVVSAYRSGRLRHPGRLGLRLDSLIIDERVVPVVTTAVVAHGGSHKKRNWGWIGGGTGGGALLGALAAGGKGALIGSGIGAAAGTTTALVTGKKDVRFSSERVLRFRLQQEATLS